MDMESAYRLVERDVCPSDLLLAPSNPRLITHDLNNRIYLPHELLDPNLQARLLDQVCQREYEVQKLMRSIQQKGFITGMQPIIVKDVGTDSKYLVLEGNRRTAAIKMLTQERRISLPSIRVSEFQYIPTADLDEREVIDILLGTIHVDGPKEWGAWQKAVYVYNSYMRHLKKDGGSSAFRYDLDIAGEVGAHFNLKKPGVRKLLTIRRVYEQLQHAGYPVQPDHYTLIDLATKTRAVRQAYFGLRTPDCRLSDVGLERLGTLCISVSRAVHNPELFKMFTYVFKHGTSEDVQEATESPERLKHVHGRVDGRIARRAFLDELRYAREHLLSLNLTEFRGTAQECSEILRIHDLVERFFLPLVKR